MVYFLKLWVDIHTSSIYLMPIILFQDGGKMPYPALSSSKVCRIQENVAQE